MKTIYLIVLVCLAQLSLYAQSRVRVIDGKTHAPLSSATVFFPETKSATKSDINGFFTLPLHRGSILTEVSTPGYKTWVGMLSVEDTLLTVSLESSAHTLKEISVSASSSKLQGENVSPVEHVRLKENPLLQGTSLGQKLTGIAGVSNYSTGTGIGKPVIRGLSGNRIAVFSQGIRVENQQWGDEHGLGLDENGYEQVEVIKGPSSLLYGSDALGGVLYFSDERYAADRQLDLTLNSEYNSNTEGWRNTGALKLSAGRFHWNLFGGYTTHKDYEDGNNHRVPNSRFRTGDLKTTLGYTGTRFASSLKYNYLDEQYGLAEADAPPSPNGRTPGLPYQELGTHLVSSENTLFFENSSKLKFDLGYLFNSRKEFESHEHEHEYEGDHDHEEAHTHTEDEEAALWMNLSTLSYNLKWYSPTLSEHWTLIAGSQGMYQTNTNKGEEVLIPDASTTEIGAFVSSDYYYTRKSYWQAGLRVDGRFIDGTQYGTPGESSYISAFDHAYYAFNFSTGIFHSFSDPFSLRASLSSGYRAPNMFELLSNGAHEGTNRYEIGNTGLQTEKSYQADVSLQWQGEHISLFLNPYFNYIRDYIYLQPTGEIREELPVYQYTQDNAYLFGGEAGFHLHPHPLHWLHLEASYSGTYGHDIHGNDLPLIPAPKIHSTLSGIFEGKGPFHRFSAFVQYQYTLPQNRIATYETPTSDYSLVNTGIHLELRIRTFRLLADVTVNNLFDKAYYDHLSRYKPEGIYNIGRNIVCKLSIPINVAL